MGGLLFASAAARIGAAALVVAALWAVVAWALA